MIGALIGDMVGSRFEFHNIKTKDFELISPQSTFTDDSVLTIAVMDMMCHMEKGTSKEIARYFQKWARRYPNAGYGGRFYYWKDEENPQPYNSCGNGSAMRISSVGWVAQSEEEVKLYSKLVTEVTHNHPEGIKGAEVTAMCIFYALHGKTKEEIREYAIKEYPEIAKLDYEELRRTYKHEQEICQVTVPQALYCFFISDSFEDCLRTTISIGGDCDTTAAISSAIAEAYYYDDKDKGVQPELIKAVREKLPEDMNQIIDDFDFFLNFLG